MNRFFPYRSSHRLRGFDYSLPDAYYVTICTFKKRCIFGEIHSGQVYLNALGEIVRDEWLRTPELRTGVTLGEFVVMPNHMHGIIVIGEIAGDLPVAPTGLGPRRGSLGAIVGSFKGEVTKKIRQYLNMPLFDVWQRDYYDHIIRDGDDWDRIEAYILENPINWASDPENPANRGRPSGRPYRA